MKCYLRLTEIAQRRRQLTDDPDQCSDFIQRNGLKHLFWRQMCDPAIAQMREAAVSVPGNCFVGLLKSLDLLSPRWRNIVRPVVHLQRLQ